MAQQTAVAGPPSLAHAGTHLDDLAGTQENVPESLRGRKPVQVPGATRQCVVQDEEVPYSSGGVVGHSRGYDGQVIGVAAVVRVNPSEQGGGERQEPLLDPGEGDR